MFKNDDMVTIKEAFRNPGETGQLYRVVNVNEVTKRCYIELADCQLPLSPQELVSFDMLYLVYAAPTKVHKKAPQVLEDEQGTEYTQLSDSHHYMSQSTGEIYHASLIDSMGNPIEIEPLHQHLKPTLAEQIQSASLRSSEAHSTESLPELDSSGQNRNAAKPHGKDL